MKFEAIKNSIELIRENYIAVCGHRQVDHYQALYENRSDCDYFGTTIIANKFY